MKAAITIKLILLLTFIKCLWYYHHYSIGHTLSPFIPEQLYDIGSDNKAAISLYGAFVWSREKDPLVGRGCKSELSIEMDLDPFFLPKPDPFVEYILLPLDKAALSFVAILQ